MSLTRVKNITSNLTVDGTLTTTSTGTSLTSNSFNVVKIQTDKDDNGSNDDGILQFTNGSSNTVKGEIRYDESEAMFEIGHGDNQGHLRINSNGYVTKPNNPAFYARHTSATTYNSAYLQNFTVTYDITNSFNSTTGTFTAPIGGVYQVNAMLGNNYAIGDGNYNIKVNGNSYNGLIWDPYTGQSSWSTSILVGLVKLTANDAVRIYCNAAGHPDNSDWTSWSMALIG